MYFCYAGPPVRISKEKVYKMFCVCDSTCLSAIRCFILCITRDCMFPVNCENNMLYLIYLFVFWDYDHKCLNVKISVFQMTSR